MSKALKTLPWVEQESIKMDTNKHEVSFKLTKRSDWNETELRKALKDNAFPEMTVKAMPPP
ncbi:MAG: hypothetical protein HY289_15290 [Planctomycetes bacterium]|nr:hypothetical protein [Planctomycetota bacterium]